MCISVFMCVCVCVCVCVSVCVRLLSEHIIPVDEESECAEAKAAVKEVVRTLYPNSTIPANAQKVYQSAVMHKKVG